MAAAEASLLYVRCMGIDVRMCGSTPAAKISFWADQVLFLKK